MGVFGMGVSDAAAAEGEVVVEVYDAAACRARAPDWGALDASGKLAHTDALTPVSRAVQSNVTTVGLHRLLVKVLDGSQGISGPIDALALGRSGDAPAESDTVLGDEVARVGITEFSDEGSTLQIRTFVGEGEANVNVNAGEAIREVGLYAGAYFLNHAVFATPIEKDNSKTVTVTVNLTFMNQP